MDYLACVRRGIDHIERHLDDEIALADVGRAAGLSQWHFQRIFKALTNETLKTYIRSRRLACALAALRDPQARIIDIALAAGFESQESFTRAFRKVYRMTPGQYRRIGSRSLFPAKPEFNADYLQHLHQGVSLTPSLQHWPAQRVVGLHTRFFGVDSDKNNLAHKLPPLWDAFLARMGDIGGRVPGPGRVAYGLLRPVDDESDQLHYVACVPVTGDADVPAGMVSLSLPAASHARFIHRGPVSTLDHTVNYAYSSWLLGSGHQHDGGWDVEVYGEQYHPTDPGSVIHYAMPINSAQTTPAAQ
ncbi:helix-turn-helix domain-containing protein [Albitalea terrae]|uniref:Helix-turn-helix domain-containing protein n=1 Tax=Piscinibacter terrae TaxID=2496871 RepID=A0A3N7HLS2_9BURK|nr:helix-turn-helix domain-containing protein [Albitalea terrae]